MACTRDINYQNSNGTVIDTIRRRIRKYTNFYPSFNPIINNLSSTLSLFGIYSQVYINGSNFQGTAFVNFGTYKNLPIIFYSSFNISFVVPKNAPAGIYDIVVVNLYNGQLSPAVKYSYSGVLNSKDTISLAFTGSLECVFVASASAVSSINNKLPRAYFLA